MASFIKYLIFPCSINVQAARGEAFERVQKGCDETIKFEGENLLKQEINELEVNPAPSSGLLLCFRPPIVIQSNPLSSCTLLLSSFLSLCPLSDSRMSACLPARLSHPFPPSLPPLVALVAHPK